MKSIHPFSPFIHENANRLIIGTIPPPRFCQPNLQLFEDDVNFYYGSKDNAFWHILNEIFNANLTFINNEKAIEERKNLLSKLNIGITDIIDECTHQNNSAADKDIIDIEYSELSSLLLKHPEIDTLIYTSQFVKKQINNLFKTYHSIINKDNHHQSIKINGKTYSVYILYSPSPNALRNLGKNGEEKRKKQYKKLLSND